MSVAAALIEAVRDLGATISRLPDGRLWLTPAAAVPPDLIEQVREHKAELLRLVPPTQTDDADRAEIAWRVEAMLPQVPSAGAIRGLLTAREGAWPADGRHCVSCGDPLPLDAARTGPLGFSVRCEFCREAAWLAIERGRAGR